MASKKNSKNAVVFCCIPSYDVISFLITSLRKRKYHVPLLVTCPCALNYAMNTPAIMDMGRAIGEIVDKVMDPPAVLAVTSTRQVEATFQALDPDLALIYYFPYPISKRLLSGRAPFVNLHPGKLPLERGPFPGLWPTLHPERYSMDDLAATFHYMNGKVDEGPIIKEIPLKDHYPEGTTLATRPPGLIELATGVFFEHLDEVLVLVEGGFKGTPQPKGSERGAAALKSGGGSYGARFLRDDERTITKEMTKDDVMKLVRATAETDNLIPPLVHWDGRRYTVERAVEWDEFPGQKEGETIEIGTCKRVGFDLIMMFEGGPIRMAVRTR